MNRLILLSTFVLMLFVSTAAHAAAYTVNAADDTSDGACNAAHCSLREAILAVNVDGSGSISFAIGSGPVTITVGPLPVITAAVTLDGTTQPGYSGTPIVKIRGTFVACFQLGGSNITVRGFDLGGTSYGIRVNPAANASNIAIERNFIGLDPSASVDIGVDISPGGALTNVTIGNGSPSGRNLFSTVGSGTGINVSGADGLTIAGNYFNLADDGTTSLGSTAMVSISITGGVVTVGGTSPGARNVIGGGFLGVGANGGTITIEGNYIGTDATGTAVLADASNLAGISVSATGTSILRNVIAGHNPVRVISATGTVIRGNFIGTDPTGTTATGAENAIGIFSSTGTIVGGTSPADRNILAGGFERIRISSASNTTVAGNYIGVSASGTTAFSSPQAGAGVLVFGSGTGNVIGGSAAGAGNVIAGTIGTGTNGGGISLNTSGSVTVLGNRIGTNAAGTATLGNAGWGIRVNAGSHVIGGTGPGEGNTIAGATSNATANTGYGIAIFGSAAATILGNRIGTDVSGNVALGNAVGGILLNSTNATITIGGSAAGAANVISGNGTEIDLRGDSTVTIQGNRIGTNAAGTADINSSATGILVNALAASTKAILIGGAAAGEGNLLSGFSSAAIDATTNGGVLTIRGNQIGTDLSGSAAIGNFRGLNVARNNVTVSGNTIAHSSDRGIAVTSGTGVRSSGNSMYANGALGIDLNADGVTPNDAGDPDTGANNLQNFPVLVSALISGGATMVSGALDSVPNASFLIELYANATGHASGHGEGRTAIGSTTVTTNAGGNATFNAALPPVAAGSVISATATNLGTNDTSEFSANVIAGSSGTFQFSAATYAIGEAGPSVSLTVTRTGGTVPATVDYTTTNGTAVAGNDFTAAGGTLTFGAADTSRTIVIPIANDALDEAGETFSVTLSNAGGATIGAPSVATVTINDDDAAPALSVSDPNVTEGNSGTTTLTFNVSLSTASGRPIAVDYTTIDQTANAGSDYGARFGTLTFDPGETLKTIAVTVNGDTMAEANETLRVLLSNASNATLGDAEGVGTIGNDDGPPSISITGVTAIEGNSGTSTATLTVALTNPSSSIVTVDWATNGNTATSGSDFASANGTATFNPGDTSETITVTIHGDISVEGNESFFVNLSNAANGAITGAQATVTIADDDGTPSLTISNVAVDEDAGTATVTVLLAPSSAQTVTVNASTSAGTATAGADYTTTNTVLTFAAGETSQSITVPIADDLVSEGAETFSVTLDTPVNAAVADGTATVTIIDDDPTPQLTITDPNVIEGDAGTTPAAFTVSLSHASASTITVNWATAAGSATSGIDFGAASGSLTLLAGETSKPVTVSVLGDTSDEADETFFVTLSSPANATVAKAQGTATITDDDGMPSLVISDATVTEGDAGSNDLVFTVTLAGATAQSVTVHYATANGTASAGSDYAANSGMLTFPSGTTTQQVHVAVIGDASVETNETLFVNLSGAVSATISDNQATGTIANDDSAAAVPAISIGDVTLAEGNAGTATATFTVSLSMAATDAVSVQYATANGSATAGSDYAAASGTVHFAPGVTSQNITITVAGDVSVEPDETFTVALSNPTNATVADSQGTGVIVNDDSAAAMPSLAISDANVDEGDAGTRNATFTVRLSSPSAAVVTCLYATGDGSATAGSDYAASSGTVTFAPGRTSETISVAVAGDIDVESNESFFVTLSSPANATFADARGKGTIVNDDFPATQPVLAVSDVTIVEGDAGMHAVTFVVTLSASTSTAVTAEYETADGTAVAGADYVAARGTLLLPPGVTSQTIDVAIFGDTEIESDETFRLVLRAVTGAVGSGSEGTATIRDDDSGRAAAILPIAGSGGGSGGAFFRTTLQFHNPGEHAMTGNLVIRPLGGGEAHVAPYALQPHETSDVSAAFGTGFVTVDVAPLVGGLPEAVARVFNDAAERGTAGLTTPLASMADAITAGHRGVLLAPADGAAMRLNIGTRSLDEGVAVTFALRRASGQIVDHATRTLAPNVLIHESAEALFSTPLEPNDSIDVSVQTGSAIVYGSAVDNISQDPSFVIVRPLP
jgi:CSLREA domain-containing protein